MKLQRLAAFGAAALAAIGLTMAAATPALAHDELRDKGLEFSTTGELSALTFTFSNDIMAVGTEIFVTDETGKNVASAQPEVSGPTVRQALDTPLAAGAYQAATEHKAQEAAVAQQQGVVAGHGAQADARGRRRS